MKRIISMILVIIILSISTSTFASFSDVSSSATYNDAISRVVNLGIMTGDTKGAFKPNSIVTREQFAQIIVIATGLDEVAGSLNSPTIYSDVDSKNVLNGYINEAVLKGYVSSMADGKFHPKDGVTYAQVCTAMISALGYTAQDVPGLWPKNYIEKARNLQITAGITLNSGDKVPRWVVAVMVDNLLDTNVKKTTAADPDKTLETFAGISSDNIYTVYSKPEVVSSFNPLNKKIGQISLTDNPAIVRNTTDISTTPVTSKIGEAINISQIKDKDVVYRVSDKSNKKSYILVVDNKVTGKITGIIPDKYSPKSIQIDTKSYDLSKYMIINKINSTPGAFNIGDSVTLLLGNDGKVVDIQFAESSDNSNYAFVLNYSSSKSSDLANYGKIIYNVKLLFTDGTTGTYKIDNDATNEKGKLVTFTKPDAETVVLQDVSYLGIGETTLHKDDRAIDDKYMTNNVKVFNLISNETSADAEVGLVNWSDLPSGILASGKILYYNQIGNFKDINVLLLNDVFDQQYKMGVVEKSEYISGRRGSSYNYTLLVDGTEYVYSTTSSISDVVVGSVLKVKVVNGSIIYYQILSTEAKSAIVTAIDVNRIKINNVIYRFKDNVKIYYKDYNGTITVKGINDVITDKVYGQVSVFLDKPLNYGGRAEVIVISDL